MNTNTLWDSLQSTLGTHIPQLLGALAIFILGWLIAVIVRAAVRKSLGFIGVNFHPAFISRRVYDQIETNFECYQREIKARTRGREGDPAFLSDIEWEYFQRAVVGNDKVFLDQLIDHIVHIAALGSIDCVGLGSDFDGIASTPMDLRNAAAYPALVAGLRRRGFRAGEIAKICGLNLRAFLRRVERAAKKE